MFDSWHLPDTIDHELNLMSDSAGFDDGLARGAVECERHGHQSLQRIALRAAGRAGICLAARHPTAEIKERPDRRRLYTATIVGNRDGVVSDDDLNDRRDDCFLTVIESIVG